MVNILIVVEIIVTSHPYTFIFFEEMSACIKKAKQHRQSSRTHSKGKGSTFSLIPLLIFGFQNVKFVPQSAPLARRHPPQLADYQYKAEERYIQQQVHRHHHLANNIEEEDDNDCSRYSLRPNLSLFNVSMDNLHSPTVDFDDDLLRPQDWLDDIFHSTKIED